MYSNIQNYIYPSKYSVNFIVPYTMHTIMLKYIQNNVSEISFAAAAVQKQIVAAHFNETII